ncbi:MAG: phospholipase D-like domain-containing protein [Candidatus Pacebacteria bacterium]|nr:phospholipase D-like domain-containing protein [Candidatus Paceibacterota bacterium]
MNQKLIRSIVALVLALAAGSTGYSLGIGNALGQVASVAIPAQTVTAPEAGSTRIIYSLDQKQNDKEIIALIDAAKTHIYFAIYTFTLPSIADALVAAKKRGVLVRGIIDSEQSSNSYGAPITKKLLDAGIPIVVEKHATGNGIMHIKTLVTESAYATGSYNWTKSATTINDEVLEIGTDPALRQAYENILKKLLDAYQGNSAAAGAAASVSIGIIDYTDAPKHIGETASVRGTLVEAYTSASGTVFLDFCKSYKTCPFSGVIFADDAKAFGDLSRLAGQTVTLTGKISSYQGKAEIVLSDQSQLINK